MRAKLSAQYSQTIVAKSKSNPSRKESSKPIKNSVNDPVVEN